MIDSFAKNKVASIEETFRWYNRKEKRPWFLDDISYIVLKRRDNTNRGGNSITNAYMTRGP
jgi:hypothetical protein